MQTGAERLATVGRVLVTTLMGIFVCTTMGRWTIARWEYPLLSREDPLRVLFVTGEWDRHLA